MKRFKLQWKALNTLRVREEVSINSDGAYRSPTQTKPDYLIRLNFDGSSYVYCKYQGDRDPLYRNYIPDLEWSNCEVYPESFFWVRGADK